MEKLQEQIDQLTATVNSMRMTQDALVVRVMKLEQLKDEPAKPKVPEPVLVCVQCGGKFKESENAPGVCEIHTGELERSGRGFRWNCCQTDAYDYDSAYTRTKGCVSNDIKHKAAHHREYSYHRYKYWLNDTRNNHIKDRWIRAENPDFEDEDTCFLDTGILDNGKLYVLGGKGGYGDFLEIFEASQLAELADKESDSDIYRDEGKDYIILAQFVKLGVQDQDQLKLKLTLKSNSDDVPRVIEIDIKYDKDQNKIEMGKGEGEGAIKTVSGALKTPIDIVEGVTIPSLPDTETEGGSIVISDPVEAKKHDSEGDSKIKVSQTDAPIHSSQSFTRGNSFTQFINSEFTIENPLDSKTSVVKVESEYEKTDGEWVACDSTAIGIAVTDWRGYKSVQWNETGNTTFPVEEKQAFPLSVSSGIKTIGQGGNDNQTRARLHKSFKEPLRVKVKFTDIEGKSVSIVTECVRKPLDLPTKEERGKSWRKDVIDFVQCDDTEKDERIYMATYFDDKKFVLRASHGTYYYITSDNLLQWAYKAKKAGTLELPLEQYDRKVGDRVAFSVAALCLEGSYLPYALKISLATSTSKVTGYASIPVTEMEME